MDYEFWSIVLIAIFMLIVLPIGIGFSFAYNLHIINNIVYWEVVFLPLIIVWLVLGGIWYYIVRGSLK